MQAAASAFAARCIGSCRLLRLPSQAGASEGVIKSPCRWAFQRSLGRGVSLGFGVAFYSSVSVAKSSGLASSGMGSNL